MLWRRIAAGGFAFLAASVVNASAQSCLFPWACQESRDANSTQNVKNNLPSQKGSVRIPRPDPRRLSAVESQQQLALRRLSERDKMLDQEKEEPLFEELWHGQRQENQSTTPIDQAARDALFEEFLRWYVHQVIVE
jgi:hypothetical protein